MRPGRSAPRRLWARREGGDPPAAPAVSGELPTLGPAAQDLPADESVVTAVHALLDARRIAAADIRRTDTLVVALAVAILVLTAMAAALLSRSPDPLAGAAWLWLLVPAPVLLLAALGLVKASDNVLRVRYALELDRVLARLLAAAPAGAPRTARDRSRDALGSASGVLRRWARIGAGPGEPVGRSAPRRVLLAGGWLLGDLLLLATTAPALSRAPVVWAAAAGVLYLAVLLALNVTFYRDVVRGGERWARLLAAAGEAEQGLGLAAARGPSRQFSWRYVVWPRPDDSLVKMAYMGAGFFLGWLAGWGLGLPWPSFVGAAVFFAMFELVVYPARYILNDARDLERDREDPDPRRRAKCPDLELQRPAMFVSFVVRACLAVAYVVWLAAQPGLRDLALVFGLACVAVLAVAWWYEGERDRTTRRPPATTLGWLPLWLAVSCGGGLRLVLGAYLGLTETWAVVLVLAAVAGMSMHFCLATMVWALEAADRNPLKPHLRPLLVLALRKLPDRRSAWLDYAAAWFPALPLAAEEPSWWARVTLRRGSFEELRLAAPVAVSPRRLVTSSTRSLVQPAWRPAPWDWAAVVALVVGLVLGTVAAVGPPAWSPWTLAWSLPLAAVAGWVMTRSRPAAAAVTAACVAAAAAAGTILQYHPSSVAQPTVVALSVLLPAAFSLVFRTTTWAGLTRDRYAGFRRTVRAAPARALRASYAWFVRPRGGRPRTPPGR